LFFPLHGFQTSCPSPLASRLFYLKLTGGILSSERKKPVKVTHRLAFAHSELGATFRLPSPLSGLRPHRQPCHLLRSLAFLICARHPSESSFHSLTGSEVPSASPHPACALAHHPHDMRVASPVSVSPVAAKVVSCTPHNRLQFSTRRTPPPAVCARYRRLTPAPFPQSNCPAKTLGPACTATSKQQKENVGSITHLLPRETASAASSQSPNKCNNFNRRP